MANYQILKDSIMRVIKQNGNEEITGDLLQQTLIAMVNAIGNGYNFKGLAQSSSPTPSDTNVFYIVNTPGEYTNYGPNMRVLPNEIAIFKYDGQWHKDLVLNDRFVDFNTAQIINNIKTFAVGFNAPFCAITDTEQGITLDVALDAKADEAIVATILALIPSQATPQNQLADKDYVNASISSNTANFIGTFDSLEELEEYPTAGLTNNDYAFVVSTDSQGNVVYKRYKWVANSDAWLFEYDLNNSSFTATQWAAINSGITQGNWDYVLNLVQQWVDIIPDDATAQNPLVTRQYLKDRHIILPLLTQEATQAQLQEVYNAIMGAPNDAAFFLTLPDNRGIMPLAVAKGGTMAFAQYADGRFSHELKITLADNVYILEKTDRELATSDAVDTKIMELLDGLENSIIIPALAENLNSPDGVTEQTPFIFRTTGGAISITSGFAEIKTLKGNSVVWNQYIQSLSNGSGISISYDSTTNTYTGEVNETIYNKDFRFNHNFIQGHKYLFVGNVRVSAQNNVRLFVDEFFWSSVKAIIPNEWTIINGIIVANSSIQSLCRYEVQDYTVAPGVVMDVKNPVFYDLTQMFGAGNEPSTYEEFIARKPLVADEYAYNPGEIISVDVDKIKTTGFNQWDEQWENGYLDEKGEPHPVVGYKEIISKNFIPVVPNESYYVAIGRGFVTIGFYDANHNLTRVGYFANRIFNVANNEHYIRFASNNYGLTYNHDICINLSWSGYRNGEYQPYESHELNLSWYKEIDSDGNLLFENGKLRSAGTASDGVTETQATKRIGIKVFDGTEDWIAGFDGFRVVLASEQQRNAPSGMNYISNHYEKGPFRVNYVGACDDMQFYMLADANMYFFFKDNRYYSENNPTAWKSHLAELYAQGNPLTVYYELADPIVVKYDKKVMNYRVDDFGTEEFVVNDGVTAPVAHTIIYKTNLRDEIRNLPKNYESQTSMDNALNAIAAALNLTITKTWNDTTKAYQYTVTQNVETAMMPPMEQ